MVLYTSAQESGGHKAPAITNKSDPNVNRKLQKERKYDLVYCQQPVGGLMGRLIGRKFKLPVIYTAHGFNFLKGNNPLKNFYSFYRTAVLIFAPLAKAEEAFAAAYAQKRTHGEAPAKQGRGGKPCPEAAQCTQCAAQCDKKKGLHDKLRG